MVLLTESQRVNDIIPFKDSFNRLLGSNLIHFRDVNTMAISLLTRQIMEGINQKIESGDSLLIYALNPAELCRANTTR